MQGYFAFVENVEQLVPLTMTVPMAVMAVFGMAAGAFSDRFGRKWVLVVAALMYGAIGTAPLYLQSLHSILMSRAILGVVEVFILVVGTALIGDFFSGNKRARLLALQTTIAAICAFAFNNIGGALGDIGWRIPYTLYSVGFVLAIFAAIFLWEPERQPRQSKEIEALVDQPHVDRFMITVNCLLAVFAGFTFIAVPVNFGYLFHDLGIDSTAGIGIAYGLNSLGVMLGSLIFGWTLSSRFSVNVQLFVAYLGMGIGFIGMWYSNSYLFLTLSGICAGIGGGVLMPAMVNWNIDLLPARIRGLGQGAYQASGYVGQFFSGIAIVWAASVLGGRAETIKWLGVVLIVAAVISLCLAGRQRQ